MKQNSQSGSRAESSAVATQRIRESVSALMDGEARELELRQVLADANRDVVDASWRRYHLVRQAFGSGEQAGSFLHLDISARVSDAIAAQAPAAASLHRWWLKPVAGFAVAASVAAGVVITVQRGDQVLPGADMTLESTPAVASNRAYPLDGASMKASTNAGPGAVVNYPVVQLPGAIAASDKAADAEARRQLDKYLLRHTESAALNNTQGMISFARVASFESE